MRVALALFKRVLYPATFFISFCNIFGFFLQHFWFLFATFLVSFCNIFCFFLQPMLFQFYQIFLSPSIDTSWDRGLLRLDDLVSRLKPSRTISSIPAVSCEQFEDKCTLKFQNIKSLRILTLMSLSLFQVKTLMHDSLRF